MQDELRKLHQLQAAMRLRALQREKAELKHGKTQYALVEAERLLRDEQAQYASVLTRLQQQTRSGISLDPSLHEQRLLAQLSAYSVLKTHHQAVTVSRLDYREALGTMLKSKVDEDVASKAHDRVGTTLQQYVRSQELIDIFDAQQAQRVAYGV